MMNRKMMRRALLLGGVFLSTLALTSTPVLSVPPSSSSPDCAGLPTFGELQTALSAVVTAGGNGGLANHMWATVVNRDGVVCAVAKTGAPGDQWPGSRVISAQKANTANAFSLPPGSGGIAGLALSTANLFSAVQTWASLFGLQESNPVDTAVAYVGSAATWGTGSDDLVGKKIGGVNVFGGGLALYNTRGALVGGIGVSGDTSCTDHIVAWKVRFARNLDNVPAGVNPRGDDNIIFDITGDHNNFQSKSGFGHPTCLSLTGNAKDIAEKLPLAD